MAVYYGTSVMDTLTPSVQRGERCLALPCNSHSFCLPPLSNTLPLFHEMCKRFARFITQCMFTSSELVQMVVHHSIHQMGFISTITKNMRCVYNLFGWSMRSLLVAVYQCTMTNSYASTTVYTGIIGV